MAENVKQVEGAIEYLSAVIDGKALGLRAHAALHTIAAAARKAVPETPVAARTVAEEGPTDIAPTTATTGPWLRHDVHHRGPLHPLNDGTDAR